MDEPKEITDRRWRFNLMGAIESLAKAKEPSDLHDTELIAGFFDCVTDECSPHGAGAMTADESAGTHELCEALNEICEKARLAKRDRIGGRVVHGLEPQDLVSFGWFDRVQPLACDTFDVFMRRGWLSEGLFSPRS